MELIRREIRATESHGEGDNKSRSNYDSRTCTLARGCSPVIGLEANSRDFKYELGRRGLER